MNADVTFALFFWLFAAMIVISAFLATFLRNIMKAALALFFTFFGMAGMFLLLAADFLAITQVVVYVGGILVLMLVAVMVTHRSRNALNIQLGETFYTAIVLGGLIFCVLLYAIFSGGGPEWIGGDVPAASPTTAPIGEILLTSYLLPFEVASVTLLMALLGASYLARHRPTVQRKTTSEKKQSKAAGEIA